MILNNSIYNVCVSGHGILPIYIFSRGIRWIGSNFFVSFIERALAYQSFKVIFEQYLFL